MRGMPEYQVLGSGNPHPLMNISIEKLGNGYVLSLTEYPKMPEPTVPAPSPFEGLEPDELIDKMIDGVGALIRAINDKGAGEHWKDEEDRVQIREAFKVMFPQLARQADRLAGDPSQYQPPRSEQRVFESKDVLVEYLVKNL